LQILKDAYATLVDDPASEIFMACYPELYRSLLVRVRAAISGKQTESTNWAAKKDKAMLPLYRAASSLLRGLAGDSIGTKAVKPVRGQVFWRTFRKRNPLVPAELTFAIELIGESEYNSCFMDALVIGMMGFGIFQDLTETREQYRSGVDQAYQPLATLVDFARKFNLVVEPETERVEDRDAWPFQRRHGVMILKYRFVKKGVAFADGQDHAVVFFADYGLLVDNDGDVAVICDEHRKDHRSARQAVREVFDAPNVDVHLIKVYHIHGA
jgi:hypothetical protein